MFEDDDKDNKKKRSGGDGSEGGDGGDGKGPPKGVDFKSSRYLFVIILIGIVMAVVFGMRSSFPGSPDLITWTEFREQLKGEKFKTVQITGREVKAEYQPVANEKGKSTVRTYAPEPFPDSEYAWLMKTAEAAKTQVKNEIPSPIPALLWNLLPWLLLVFVFYFFVFRQLRGPGGPGGVLSFGKSRATLITKEKIKKTFKDVAGVDEAKSEVEEIVGFLKNPKKFQRLGGRIPKGVLLIGTPGTGKTLLAKSIAGEADVPFFSISGSDFVEMFVGVGASRVRDLFQTARENSPCIIFLDEIDAVGRRRGTGIGGGHDEREQTLNEILVQMDGMESDDKIIVMAATNRPDVLDPALLRPGRFDRHVYVDLPDVKGREEILRVHTKKVKLAPEVDLTQLAKSTAGSSGADLENIINEAALIAVMKDKDGIDMQDLDEARDKVAWGREKKSRVMDEAERWVTAYHETGHALISYYLPECDKPTKVSVIPRGRALGITIAHPNKDVYSLSKKQLLGRIKMCYGGRIAEEMFTGDITTGAQNDIEQATNLVRRMVCEWGMSEKLGPIKYSEHDDDVFIGHEMAKGKPNSENTAVTIDSEIRNIIQTCYEDAREVLEAHRAEIELIAKALMEHEVLSGEEIDTLIKTGKLERKMPAKQVVHRPLPKSTPSVKKPEADAGPSLEGSSPSPQPA
ncbi:MAG TPA: ATP-dependent zinc metalloprotease FtsH [Planctomycetota bacterium]|nr:ATP-dependent zinc metalloprotease FtsH [Planctomycetota bacterium]